MVTAVQNMGFMSQMFQHPCPACQGAGQLASGCASCSQKKHTTQIVNLNMNIQAGIEDGSMRRIDALGDQARTPNETPGDLIIVFRIKKHPVFERNNKDLRYTHTLSLEESINGTRFRIPHFLGDLDVSTHDFAPVIDPRKDYKIEGKGLTDHSHLYVHFDIQYPTDKSLRYQLVPTDYIVS